MDNKPAGEQKALSLKGSVGLVVDFIAFALQSILSLRGVLAKDKFGRILKFGLDLPLINDRPTQKFLGQILEQVQTWVNSDSLRKVVLVIYGLESMAVLDRWTLEVDRTRTSKRGMSSSNDVEGSGRDENTKLRGGSEDGKVSNPKAQVAALFRNLDSTVSFLPAIEEKCTFDILVYASSEVQGPRAWEECGQSLDIPEDEAEVEQLRSFFTGNHEGSIRVEYRP